MGCLWLRRWSPLSICEIGKFRFVLICFLCGQDENSHAHLAEQFKKHTIKRVYVSVTCGVPSPTCGRIEIPIGRDLNNRLRMIAAPGLNTRQKARYAASRWYKILYTFLLYYFTKMFEICCFHASNNSNFITETTFYLLKSSYCHEIKFW